MRYFTYIAEQSFKTAPTGERLFYTGGPWSRPYILPDAASERRVYWKQVWFLRIVLGGLLLLQPLAYVAFPELIRNQFLWLGLVVGFVAFFVLVQRIALAGDLRGLDRAPGPLAYRAFYAQMAERHSARALWLGFGTCLIFVGAAILMLVAGSGSTIEAVFVLVFFLICAVIWAYAIVLKRGMNRAASVRSG